MREITYCDLLHLMCKKVTLKIIDGEIILFEKNVKKRNIPGSYKDYFEPKIKPFLK